MLLLFNLLSYSPSVHVKVNTALWYVATKLNVFFYHFHNCLIRVLFYEHIFYSLTRLYELNIITSSDPLVSLKLIPSLVLLCKPDVQDNTVRATAATTLG